jgi:hypothetical protein
MQNKTEQEDSIKSRVVAFRTFQSIFWGVFALGISLVLGDLAKAINIPIGSFSLTTTIFGLIGALICGYFANSSKDW